MNFLKKIEKAFTDCIFCCFMALNPKSAHIIHNKKESQDRVVKGEYRKIDIYSSDDEDKPIINPYMKRSDEDELFDEFDMVLP